MRPGLRCSRTPNRPAAQFVLIRKLAPDKGQDMAAFRRFVVERLAVEMLNARLFERAQVADPAVSGG